MSPPTPYHGAARTGALLSALVVTVLASTLPAAGQQVIPPAGSTRNDAPPERSAPPPVEPAGRGRDEPITLSPFEVNTSQDRGYFAASTLSGTRLNSQLRDLPSSISVVTKQQLIDTAALDINDVFLYESNTEGLYQYTEYVQDRSFYNEVTTLNPQSANRIRGLGTANRARNHFVTSSSIPLDSYNIESVEISRGPNANLFGLGEASGTVNTNPIEARLNGDITQVQLRGDSYGGWRTQLDFSRPLATDKVAIRVAALREDKGFEREPASEVIDRATATITIRPVKQTTFRFWYENYENAYNRANTTLPRDGFSEWMQHGMPVWNPTFGTSGGWRYFDGDVYTGVAPNEEAAAYPRGFLPTQTGFSARPSAYIVDGQIVRYEASRASNAATPNANGPWRYAETGDIIRRGGNVFGVPPLILYRTPGVSDRSMYDWEDINFLAPNFGRDRAKTYMATLEQTLLETPSQFLAAQLGFYREEVNRFDHNFLSRTDGATPYVTIDVNEFFIDGTPNPYFLRPYIGASEPRINYVDETNDNYRATFAYQLDLRRNEGWTRWLGFHRLAGYGEYRELLTSSYFARDRNIANYDWTSANDNLSLPLRGATYNVYSRYYVGGPVTEPGPVIDYAPTAPRNIPGSLPFIWYPSSGRTPRIEDAMLDPVIAGGSSTLREIESYGLTWQGFFWKDRIVPTVGWREDTQREKRSRGLNSNPTQPTTTIDPETRRHDLSWIRVFPNPAVESTGRTKTYGLVFHAFPWLSLHYNRSDSFKPEPVRYDINLNLLSNSTGDGKDYGATFTLFDGKVVAKLNRYEVVEKNSRSGSTSGAFAARTFRFFFDPEDDLALNADGMTFANELDAWDLEQMAATWYLSENPGASADEAIAAARSTWLAPFGFDDAFIDEVRDIGLGGFAEVNTVTSKGYEFELAFNPTRYWTLKLAAARQQAIDSELSNNINRFFEENIDTLESLVVPTNAFTLANGTAGQPWWMTTPTANPANTPQNFYFVNILTTLKQASANAGKPRPQTREWRFSATTNYQLAGITDHKWLKNLSVGGSLRWEDKAALGYYGDTTNTVNGAIVEYDPNRPIYDKARTYVDLMAAYNLRLFNDKVRCRLQLNVRNVFESGRLQPFVYNPDGTPWNYRIIDPRQFILSATFDL